jgi:hypothetical protein
MSDGLSPDPGCGAASLIVLEVAAKEIGFLSFGHRSPSPMSKARSGSTPRSSAGA